jgi:hypothetical protein
MRLAWNLDPHWRMITRVPAVLVTITAVLLLAKFEVSPVTYIGDGRRDIYGALLTTFSTLLGISYAVTAMIIGFSDRASLSVYVRSTDYPDIALMMRDTNRALALSTVISFALMIADRRAAEPWIFGALLGSATWSLSVLGMAMNRFTTMLHRVAQSHSQEAGEQHQRDLDELLSDPDDASEAPPESD